MGWAKYFEDNAEINNERVSHQRAYINGDRPSKSDYERTGKLPYTLKYVNGRFIIPTPLNPGYVRC